MPEANQTPTPSVKDLLSTPASNQPVVLNAWVRTRRDSKNLVFLALSDGSCFSTIQAVIDKEQGSWDEKLLAKVNTGAGIQVQGSLTVSPGSGQTVEIQATGISLHGEAPQESYPLQKKRHSFEFLREIAHLRPRTNTFGAVARVRNAMSFAIHRFFQERGFFYVHTPIITGVDAEGAGQMFRVTTLPSENPPRKEGSTDFSRDFFGRPTYLAVTGQLEAEAYALSMGRVYTFGPTFRAENSNTTRHLAEFWMIEPEVAFCDINCNMDLAEDFLKFIISTVLEECREDMAFFNQWIQKGIIDVLKEVVTKKFARVSYTEAMKELEKAQGSGSASFDFPVQWGSDLQSEHEKFLTETVYKGPVIVTDYPKEIKAFYMKQNGDGKTVRAMDVLVPRLGEIIGGSEREADLSKLEARMDELGMHKEDYRWYLELRKYGSVPHSGFGLGFERLIQYITGMQNIRDVIPFPRTVKSAEF
ncbi:asparagine--tRNA ligase [Marispirochaeta aestuarii]|uniref:asparagine--tRNA ligase n=1 Tax=Marispirochaeta aestuarii TaxID=1963862 RepID=UPI0029C64208|nr:asparagine--tRNA ligase [Marispirochaeta aestuarii]